MTGAQWLAVVIAGVVTYAVRSSLLVVADRMARLPHRVTTLLRMIPPAALAALVFPAVLRPGGGPVTVVSALVVGAIVAGVVSYRKRSMGLALVAGLVVVTALGPVLG